MSSYFILEYATEPSNPTNNSYFMLDLDTTGPNIQIYAPSYTSKTVNNTITIVGDETLSVYQNIYIMDSQGTRHDVIFSFDGNSTFTGQIVFNNFPNGVATIFAQLQDEVGNLSNLATAHISIIASTYYSIFKLTMTEKSVSPQYSVSKRTSTVGDVGSSKVITEQHNIETLTEQKRIVVVSDTN